MARLVLVLLSMLCIQALAQAASDGPAMDIDGAWFPCEFAHSQIPPEDGCQMLDDDGFMVSDGQIAHIKVTNSRQQGCRHKRLGQCFLRDKANLVASRDPIGEIRPTATGFAITYWGCSQKFLMGDKGAYFEITPTDGRCWWTRDKRYFIARYQGVLQTHGP